ncbi:MAG: hypothetical protein Q8O89_02980 [Nanoarchaeota archaeon]|nr:hypothetical protein [Nanoarchaeota archaeon]
MANPTDKETPKLRSYITGQITGSNRTSLSIISMMVLIAEEKGIDVYCPERDTNKGNLDNPEITPEEIYTRDTDAVKKSDFIVIECSNPSTGNGLEIMLAYLFDKRIICVYQKDAAVSRMLLGMPSISFIIYDTAEDLQNKFTNEIEKIKKEYLGQ